jgi:hypothetical protein
VDLAGIDVREQQRILQHIEQQQWAQRQPPKPPKAGKGSGSKRRAADAGRDGKQPKISSFLRQH